MKATLESREKFNTNVEELNELINNHIESNSEFYSHYKDVDLVINDISQALGSGYGTWKTVVEINDKKYSLTHHSEDWYNSLKILYNEAYQCGEAEEQEENIEYLNMSVYRCIEANISNILSDNKPTDDDEES